MSTVEDARNPAHSPAQDTAKRRGLIGAGVSRIDGPPKVRGKAPYAAEFALDDMVYAALVFSTVAKGGIATLDTSAAEAAPGVVLVMTHRNAPRMQPIPLFETSEKAGGIDNRPIMQDDRVYWNGQPVAVVLAQTQEQADHASSLIQVTYEAEPATTSLEQAKANGTDTAELFGHSTHIEIGDAQAALAAAPVSVDTTYRTPYQNHNAIEPHAVTVAWNGDELVVHDSCQIVVHVAWTLAQVFGVEEQQVRVTAPYVGGHFGGKGFWSHQALAAAAAKLAGRPVRLALSREGVYRVVGGRTRTEQRVAIGADADGRFNAIIHTGTIATTRDNPLPEGFTSGTRSAYAAGNFELDVQTAYQDMVANSPMRAPGETVGNFALESAVDEVAVALGMDPIELRTRNEPDKDPTDGRPFSARHAVEAWRAGAERFGWAKRNPTPGTVRDGEWLVGMGCAGATHLYVRQPGGAARLTLTRDGHVTVEVAAHDAGMGLATAQTQIIAEQLALDPAQVSFLFADSTMPGLVAALGSSQTATVAAAVGAAWQALVDELLKRVGDDSPLASLTAEEVGSLDGGLAKLDEPTRHERYASILARAGRDEITVEASAPPPMEMMNYSMHSYGAIFCEVRVSAVTGEVRVSRVLGSLDCGRVINAKTAASQFRGGIVMGLGLALMEETRFDERNGRIMNPSLAEYHVPVHLDLPEIDVIWTDIPDPQAPMGARGIGELSITGAGAAVANAVFNATDKRIRGLPLTPDKLM